MQLHLVNGFLGSGKTTAIIALTRNYLQLGKKVAIVTNDKGRYQVDTAFFQTAHIPTGQVEGGCFRCSFEEFIDQITQLIDTADPDIVIAESVGSCVDLVNTVFPPLLSLPDIRLDKTTFSVFTDIRLFRSWLFGGQLPFSENIVYTFGQQVEESELLGLNKMDLLSENERSTVLEAAVRRFPNKCIFMQNSLAEGESPWFRNLKDWKNVVLNPAFHVDYSRYKAGEQELAWFDQRTVVHPAQPMESRQWVINFISRILLSIRKNNIPVAHLKFFLQSDQTNLKLSFTSLDLIAKGHITDWQRVISSELSGMLTLIVNARVETKSYLFKDLVKRAMDEASQTVCVRVETAGGTAYHPRVLPHQS